MGYLEKYRIFVPELRRSLHIAKYRNEQKSARFHIVTYIIWANAQLLDFQSKSNLERVNTMNRQNLLILLCMLLLFPVSGQSNNREKYNFNPGWLLYIGDTPGAERTDFSDENWKKITLPRAFNEDEAFKVHIWGMTDTIA